eukprot:CAMPEP_0171161832 /NCGR_PEP_ID=MMETSP0790-20130122/4276_1 /TAXON_ID=2925 /ORGANISM="Alexandrium catenella, Strain OF101" /LENGTH=378 /DNA_ID=CAMNT_0011626409 /DNA_START=100 /DNA_END=1236 /DNA_ORIENTATION=+
MAARPFDLITDTLAEGFQPEPAVDGYRQSTESVEAELFGADDLLYGSGVFQKLPEWMTSSNSDCEDDDGDELPYGQKLNELLAGVVDDDVTTTPPSERLAELSSASDDEAGSGTRSPSEPRAPTRESGRICSLDWPEMRRPSDCGSMESMEEDDGLVDLDPEEGRRRGAVLLALIAEKPDCSSADEAAHQRSQNGHQLLASWPQSHAKAGVLASFCGSSSSSPTAACAGKAATHALYAGIVCEAACRAFGSGAVDVANSASGGFVVWLCGWPAAELQRSHQAVLEMLSQALWPYLGQDIVGVEQRTAASAASGARLSGVASAVASTRLTLWCLAEEAKYEQSFCWQYVRSGVCPRGALCRWRHAMPPTYPIDIEVAAA